MHPLDEFSGNMQNPESSKTSQSVTSELEQLRNYQLVEEGLERVRSLAMEMRQSRELAKVVSVLYQEMDKLGLASWGCNIQLIDEENNWLEIWLSHDPKELLPKPYYFKGKGHKVIKKQWDEWREGTQQFTIALKGKSKKSYDDYVLTKTDFKNFPNEMKEGIRSMDEAYFNFARMQYGFITSIHLSSALDENQFAILSRFAKVFEQTYTRFRDLQKAEVQAREAQIEAALEKVRSAGLAMHHSNELNQLIGVVFQQLKALGFETLQCELVLFDSETNGCKCWPSNENENILPKGYRIPYNAKTFYQFLFSSWKNQRDYSPYELKGRTKASYEKWLFEQEDWKEIPIAVQKSMREIKKVFLYGAAIQHGFLEMGSLKPIEDEKFEILKRFAKVFEQNYIRFLDLKKAEAQAREAKIETALEKVRARAMAMHDSNELADATIVLFDQMEVLGIPVISSWISIVDADSDSMDVYLRTGDKMGTPTTVFGNDYDNFRKEIDSWKEGDEFIRLSNPKNQFIADVKRIFGVDVDAPEDKEAFHLLQIHHQFGFLGLGMWDEAKEEEYDIYRRFANVFEQTYTRFLDLKKAEAQAREAQIEASLERVRAKAMAMHKSEDLPSVLDVMFDQMQQLGFGNYQTLFGVIKEELNLIEYWTKGLPR